MSVTDFIAQCLLVAAQQMYRDPMALRDRWRELRTDDWQHDREGRWNSWNAYRVQFNVNYLALSQRLHTELELV